MSEELWVVLKLLLALILLALFITMIYFLKDVMYDKIVEIKSIFSNLLNP